MSGGPTINLDSSVIGINSFGIVGETQPFNFVTTSQLMLELMHDKGVKNEIGESATLYREGLDAYWAGHKSEATKKFDGALAISPAFASAQEYKTLSAKLPDESNGMPWLWIVLGLLVVAAVAAGVVIVVRRRDSSTGAAPATPSAAPDPPPVAARPAVTPPPPPPTRSASTVDAALPLLVVQTADGIDGERIPISGEMVIGRENADILLDDSEVSRRHAAVGQQDGQLQITDLGSANGTLVNGSRVQQARLKDGDVVGVGRTTLRVSVPAQRGGETVIRSTPPLPATE
jgi:hypothetical protein